MWLMCQNEWLTELHDFSFNIQMCMSQKVSRYKFVFLNTALISLCLHHLPFQISGMEQEREQIEKLQVNLSTIILFILLTSFLLPFYPNKSSVFCLFSFMETLLSTSPPPMLLAFYASLFRILFYFFPLVLG